MIHGHSRVRIYKKRHHAWTAAAALVIPILLVAIFGGIEKINLFSLIALLAESFGRLVVSYAISLVLGVALAIWLGTRKWTDSVLPVLDVLQNLPSFALIPVFALLLGYTNMMAMAFAVTSIIWPVFFSVLSALRTARTDLTEAATIFGATGWKRLVHFYLPLSFPAIVTSSLVGVSIGWEAIIGIELIGRLPGIGTYIQDASSSGENAALWGGILAILVLVFVLNKTIWMPLIKQTDHYAE